VAHGESLPPLMSCGDTAGGEGRAAQVARSSPLVPVGWGARMAPERSRQGWRNAVSAPSSARPGVGPRRPGRRTDRRRCPSPQENDQSTVAHSRVSFSSVAAPDERLHSRVNAGGHPDRRVIGHGVASLFTGINASPRPSFPHEVHDDAFPYGCLDRTTVIECALPMPCRAGVRVAPRA